MRSRVNCEIRMTCDLGIFLQQIQIYCEIGSWILRYKGIYQVQVM
jgi:hypothetical protein